MATPDIRREVPQGTLDEFDVNINTDDFLAETDVLSIRSSRFVVEKHVSLRVARERATELGDAGSQLAQSEGASGLELDP